MTRHTGPGKSHRRGVSLMDLADLFPDETTARTWFGARRWPSDVEIGETYMDGKRRNMPKVKREGLTGRGAVGKVAIAGAKDRATKRVSAAVVLATDGPTLQGFVRRRAEPGADVYTGDACAYRGMAGFDHEAVNHSVGEYVRAQAHTNGMESFWAMLKRGYHGTFHHFSTAHMQRYINEFAARQGLRERDTIAIMGAFVAGMIGCRLTYRQLTGKVGA